jgi:long-chain fatty acid transport protein
VSRPAPVSPRWLLPALFLMLLAPAARADSGFLLPPPSAEALGRAGAVAADTDEPAAVWLNPSALAFVGARSGASVGLSLLDLKTRFSPEDAAMSSATSRPDRAWSPSLYGHLRVHDRVTVGLGGHVPYGFSTDWPDGWAGAQLAISTRFHAAAVTGVAAVRLSDRWSVAAGVGAVRGDLDVVADLDPSAGGRAVIAASDWAPAGHAAVTFRLVPDRLHLAAVVHSRAALVLQGDADFSATNPAFAEIFADQGARLELTLPDVATLAALYRPRPGLSLTLELSLATYGVLDQFHLDFERPGTSDLVVERGKRTPLSARSGVQHWFGRWPLAVRGGLSFDDAATADTFQSPFAPDGQRVGVALGAGYLIGHLKLDAGYQYTHFLPADARSPRMGPLAPPRGTYKTRLHTLALTVAMRWGAQ